MNISLINSLNQCIVHEQIILHTLSITTLTRVLWLGRGETSFGCHYSIGSALDLILFHTFMNKNVVQIMIYQCSKWSFNILNTVVSTYCHRYCLKSLPFPFSIVFWAMNPSPGCIESHFPNKKQAITSSHFPYQNPSSHYMKDRTAYYNIKQTSCNLCLK